MYPFAEQMIAISKRKSWEAARTEDRGRKSFGSGGRKDEKQRGREIIEAFKEGEGRVRRKSAAPMLSTSATTIHNDRDAAMPWRQIASL